MLFFFYKYRAHICRSFQHPRCNLHIYVDTLHIYVHMQLNYVGMQNTGTFEKKHFEKMLVIKVGKGRPTQILDKQIF